MVWIATIVWTSFSWQTHPTRNFPADSYEGIEEIDVDFDTFVSEYIFGSKYKEKIIGYDNADDDLVSIFKQFFYMLNRYIAELQGIRTSKNG